MNQKTDVKEKEGGPMDIYDQLIEWWPSPIVARSEVRYFLGGAMSGKTLANLESKGIGPPSFKLRGRTVYETRKLTAWLREWNREGRRWGKYNRHFD